MRILATRYVAICEFTGVVAHKLSIYCQNRFFGCAPPDDFSGDPPYFPLLMIRGSFVFMDVRKGRDAYLVGFRVHYCMSGYDYSYNWHSNMYTS